MTLLAPATDPDCRTCEWLQHTIDTKYANQDDAGIEELEAQLEVLLERLDTDIEGFDDIEDTDRVSTQDIGAEFDLEMDDARPSPGEQLLISWYRWNGSDHDLLARTYGSFAGFIRNDGDVPWNVAPGVTDEQITEAAQEAAAAYEDLRRKMRGKQSNLQHHAIPTHGRRIPETAGYHQREETSTH